MKKIFMCVVAGLMVALAPFGVQADEHEFESPEKMMDYALIRSIGPSIDKALADYYKDPSKRDPHWIGLGEPTWAAYFGTKIEMIKQVDGEGGAYDVQVLVTAYVGPLPVAEFLITVRVGSEPQKIIEVEHVRDIKWDLARDVEEERKNYILFISMAPLIEKALDEYYKDPSKINPKWGSHPTWVPFFGNEILKIEPTVKDTEGVSYDITIRVVPYVDAHNSIAEFEMVIRLSMLPPYQKTVSFKHIKDIKYERYGH